MERYDVSSTPVLRFRVSPLCLNLADMATLIHMTLELMRSRTSYSALTAYYQIWLRKSIR